jgi:hypothetical protein
LLETLRRSIEADGVCANVIPAGMSGLLEQSHG